MDSLELIRSAALELLQAGVIDEEQLCKLLKFLPLPEKAPAQR